MEEEVAKSTEAEPEAAKNQNGKMEEEVVIYKLPDTSMYENMLKMRATGSYDEGSKGAESRKLFLMRHGERVDFTFGTWIPYCFDESGKYIRKDLNMPETIPERSLGPAGYVVDTPLTNVGVFQATVVGEAFKEKQIDVAYAYCSPSYRCIQTCDAFLKGCHKKDDIKIKIEPGLFEWLGWYPENVIPDWMTAAELVAAGFNIDQDYQPFINELKLKESKETFEQFYSRNTFVAREALNANPSGNVLLVGHSSTLEVCSRELIGKKSRSANETIKIIQKVPYCSFLQLRQEGEKWEIIEPPFPPITHSTNQRFDYKILLN